MEYRFNILVCFILACCLAGHAHAQIGMKVGFGVSDIAFKRFGQTPYIGYENNGLIHEKPLFSYETGLFYRHSIGNNWNIIEEILFAARGINYNKKYLYDDITYQINIGYLQVPIMLEYKLSKGSKSETGIYVGPYASWKMFAQLRTKIESIEDRIAAANVKTFDFGCQAGYNVNRKLTGGNLRFDFRVGYSLVNMMDPIEGHYTEYNKTPGEYARNIGIILSIGYQFNNVFNQNDEE